MVIYYSAAFQALIVFSKLDLQIQFFDYSEPSKQSGVAEQCWPIFLLSRIITLINMNVYVHCRIQDTLSACLSLSGKYFRHVLHVLLKLLQVVAQQSAPYTVCSSFLWKDDPMCKGRQYIFNIYIYIDMMCVHIVPMYICDCISFVCFFWGAGIGDVIF